MQKDPYKHLPSKFRPAAQAGQGKRRTRKDLRDKQGAGLAALQLRWEGHFEAAVKIDSRNTAKIRTAQRHTESTDTPKPTTEHCIALQRDELQLHQLEQRHKFHQPGKHHKTLTQPHPQRQTPQPRTTMLKILFKIFFLFNLFSLINHTVYSPTYLHLHSSI